MNSGSATTGDATSAGGALAAAWPAAAEPRWAASAAAADKEAMSPGVMDPVDNASRALWGPCCCWLLAASRTAAGGVGRALVSPRSPAVSAGRELLDL